MANERKTSRYSSLDKNGYATGYLMLLPALILLTIFVMIPLFMAAEKSLFNWQFYKESTFVGLDNFRQVLKTPNFRKSLLNAVKFTAMIVPIITMLAFLLAHALKQVSHRFGNIIKTAVYIPGVISGIAAGAIFLFILEYKGGVINQFVHWLTGSRIAFLTNATYATWTVVWATVWLWLGTNTILMYAGLMNVPEEYYEAASLDGANAVHKMVFITIPQMKNIMALMCINLTTLTLQIFDIPLMLTKGGPRNTTMTPVLYLYESFREPNKSMGYTIAGALLIMIVIALINSVFFTLIKSEKTAEG